MTTPSDSPSEAPETVEAPPVVRPPLMLLIAYRVLGIRLPAEYHPWVLHDAAAKTFLTWRSLRTFLWGQVLVGLGFLGYYLMLDKWPTKQWAIRAQLLVLAVVLFSSRDALVRRTLRWHRIDKYGRPVAKVKPFARLSNLEAAALGVAVLAATTGVGALVGEAQKPRGILALPCREADPAVFDRVRAGAAKDAKFLTTRMVRFRGGDLIVAIVQRDGQDKPTAEFWLVRGETVERIPASKDQPTSTTFPTVTSIDRLGGQALQRAIECLREKPAI